MSRHTSSGNRHLTIWDKAERGIRLTAREYRVWKRATSRYRHAARYQWGDPR